MIPGKLRRKTLRGEWHEGKLKTAIDRIKAERGELKHAFHAGLGVGAVAGAAIGLASASGVSSPKYKTILTMASIGLGSLLGGIGLRKFARSREVYLLEKFGEALTREHYYGKSEISKRLSLMLSKFHGGFVGVNRKGRIFVRGARRGLRLAIPVKDIIGRVYLSKPRTL